MGLLGHAAGEQRYGELRAGEAPRTDVLGWLRAPREWRAQWHPELGPRLGGSLQSQREAPRAELGPCFGVFLPGIPGGGETGLAQLSKRTVSTWEALGPSG